jgi:hypothetical protein
MYYNYIFVKVFIKNVVLGDFLIKMKELAPVCGSVFVYSGRLGVIDNSQATNRSAAGEGGFSQGVLPASYWLPGNHI